MNVKKFIKFCRRIFNILPMRFQGFFFGLVVMFYMNITSSFISDINGIFLRVLFGALLIVQSFYMVGYNYKWLSEE